MNKAHFIFTAPIYFLGLYIVCIFRPFTGARLISEFGQMITKMEIMKREKKCNED